MIYYINYCEEPKRFYQSIFDRFFVTVKKNKISSKSFELVINRKKLGEIEIEKINRALDYDREALVVFSNNFENRYLAENKVCGKILNGKHLMKYMIIELIQYVLKINEINFGQADIWVTLRSEESKKIMFDLMSEFRCINIVTDCVRKFRNFEKRAEKEENGILTLSNNRNKSLKRAKVIVNFDFNLEKLFSMYSIFRKSIIINLAQNAAQIPSWFHGIIVEGVKIRYSSDDIPFIKNIDNTLIYESTILGKSYLEVKQNMKKNKIKIDCLTGANCRNLGNNELKFF